jgi:hypothetical protein
VGSPDREANPGKGRIRRLYDRLAAIVRGLPPDRQEAFAEYLDEQIRDEDGRVDDEEFRRPGGR